MEFFILSGNLRKVVELKNYHSEYYPWNISATSGITSLLRKYWPTRELLEREFFAVHQRQFQLTRTEPVHIL